MADPQRRIKLRDGRYLAYKERGVPKDLAKFTIVLIHGFGSSKDMNFNVSQVYTNLFFFTRSSIFRSVSLFLDHRFTFLTFILEIQSMCFTLNIQI